MNLLITGAAGFIGSRTCEKLSDYGYNVTAVDNINDYYDTKLKHSRLAKLGISSNTLCNTAEVNYAYSSCFPCLRFQKTDLCDNEGMNSLFKDGSYDIIYHLAAQAGVRYSLTNPQAYISSNIQGFINILELARHYQPEHLIYASSSSVYGLNTVTPFSENDPVNNPVSLYAATKRSSEIFAYTYSYLYSIPTTGLRFFTVYGPWGRPDMAPFIFAQSIIEGKPINLFNNGNMKRDFTYIDDVVEGLLRILDHIPRGNTEDTTPTALYNIGNGKPVELLDFLGLLEKNLGKKAVINFSPMQAGDVKETWADCSALERDTGFSPHTPLSLGIKNFVEWYKEYYFKETQWLQ
jgi:UDP-glucuronate 4-epimerase